MAKKLFIKSYGCQMNVYDSARMADVMAPHGYVPTDEAADADLVILNTCHIREKAAEKVYSDIGRLREFKDARRHSGRPMVLAVAGCVAQAEGEEMLRRASAVDIVVGPQAYHRLADLVARREARRGQGAGLVDTDFPAESKFDFLPEESRPSGPSAFLTVQEGCDKFCTFCVVPYTRGAEYSRPVSAVVEEARRLIGSGAREIVLLGQNVNAYHGADEAGRERGLGALIRRLAELDGLARIRYTTSHPVDMDDDLVRAHGDVRQLMPFLHLPVQSGSDAVLARMNRRYRVADFRRAVDRLRNARPDIALSSDFIVGFPGETDVDFSATLDLVREIGFAQAYSFKYSARPGTPAAQMDERIDGAAMQTRLAALQELLLQQQRGFNARFLGRVVPVLIERRGRHAGQGGGRSPYMQAVHVESADDHFGQVVDVRIDAIAANSLGGALARPGAATEKTWATA